VTGRGGRIGEGIERRRRVLQLGVWQGRQLVVLGGGGGQVERDAHRAHCAARDASGGSCDRRIFPTVAVAARKGGEAEDQENAGAAWHGEDGSTE
jgi:hypothetical protein